MAKNAYQIKPKVFGQFEGSFCYDTAFKLQATSGQVLPYPQEEQSNKLCIAKYTNTLFRIEHELIILQWKGRSLIRKHKGL